MNAEAELAVRIELSMVIMAGAGGVEVGVSEGAGWELEPGVGDNGSGVLLSSVEDGAGDPFPTDVDEIGGPSELLPGSPAFD